MSSGVRNPLGQQWEKHQKTVSGKTTKETGTASNKNNTTQKLPNLEDEQWQKLDAIKKMLEKMRLSEDMFHSVIDTVRGSDRHKGLVRYTVITITRKKFWLQILTRIWLGFKGIQITTLNILWLPIVCSQLLLDWNAYTQTIHWLKLRWLIMLATKFWKSGGKNDVSPMEKSMAVGVRRCAELRM